MISEHNNCASMADTTMVPQINENDCVTSSGFTKRLSLSLESLPLPTSELLKCQKALHLLVRPVSGNVSKVEAYQSTLSR